MPNLTEIFDEPTTQPEQIPPRSQSPSPELSFTPLSPPPSHRNSRKADAIVGPDDPRHLGVPLCKCVRLVVMIMQMDLHSLPIQRTPLFPLFAMFSRTPQRTSTIPVLVDFFLHIDGAASGHRRC